MTLGGCTTTTIVRPADLSRLDGYQARQPASAERDLPALSGRPLTFRPESGLYLDLPDRVVGGRFDSILVRDGFFDGVTPLGNRILAPLGAVKQVRVTQRDASKTAAVVIVVSLGVIVTALGAALWIASQRHGTMTGSTSSGP
jgi:hypothetical protein